MWRPGGGETRRGRSRPRPREQGLLRIDWGARKAAGGTDDIMSAFALRETLRRRRQAVATRIRRGTLSISHCGGVAVTTTKTTRLAWYPGRRPFS